MLTKNPLDWFGLQLATFKQTIIDLSDPTFEEVNKHCYPMNLYYHS
jgi:hypothetical protein